MALQHLEFSYPGIPGASIPGQWFHSGVVGSGDMEVLLTRKEQQGKVTVKVCTPVRGFEQVWDKVLERLFWRAAAGIWSWRSTTTTPPRLSWVCVCGRPSRRGEEGNRHELSGGAEPQLSGGNRPGAGQPAGG